MSQPPQASPEAVQRQIDDLVEEITFQKVLLESIDDTVQNRGEAELEVRNEIRDLESKLRRLRRGTTTGTAALNSSNLASGQSVEAPTQNSSPKTNSPYRAPMDGYSGQEQWHSLASSTASTPNSGSSNFVSPSRVNLPTRKRSHSRHLDGGLAPFDRQGNKSRRTSPGPYLTGPTTPSTSSSGYAGTGYQMLSDGYFNLAIEEDNEFLATQLDHQKEQQRLLEERRQQEKEDEEYARIIQESLRSTPPASHGLNYGPSAFDLTSGIPPSASNSAYTIPYLQQPSYTSRTLPWPQKSANGNSQIQPEPRNHSMHSSSGMKLDHGSISHASYSPFARPSGIKAESPFRSIPGAFGDDSSEADDSDIEIIQADAFYHNRTTPQPKSEPNIKEDASKDALRMALYGSQAPPTWMSTPGPSAQSGMSNLNPYGNLFGTAQSNYVYPSMFAEPFQAPGGNLSTSSIDMLPGYSSANMHIWQPDLGYEGFDYMDHAAGSQPFMKQDPLADIIARSSGNNFEELSNYLKANDNDFMSDQLDYIMNDPRKTNDEIKALLENIKPDLDIPPEEREGTPDGMKYALYEHQKIALTWLKSMEEGTNKGGILADDMGLGKTISSLALLLSRPSSDRARKTTLIVGPVALVRQWEQEIRKKIKASHRLSTHLAHGQARKLRWDELQTFDVVLTTYGTLAHEFKTMEKWVENQKAENPGGEYNQAPMKKLFPFLGPRSLFYRVILDEAQSIKNKSTGAARAACNLKSIYRLCLTGTPMMNNVGELYSLIRFLRIKPYNEWNRFQQDFGCLTRLDRKNRTASRDVDGSMRKLQAVIKAILLRRTKKTLIDGKPIISLPPKTEEIQHVVFNDDEQAYYKALESKTQIQFNRYLRANTVGKNYSNILVLLLRLRQACCHPHLIMDCDEASPAGADIDPDAMIALAKSLSPDVVARLLEVEAFECPVCYDAAENPRIIVPCGHDTCSECLAKIADQAVQQHAADGEPGAATCKCPTCRGDLRMDRIIDFLTFKKVHKPDAVAEEQTVSETESDSGSETDSESEDDDEVSDDDLRDFIVPDNVDPNDIETEDEIEDDEVELAPKKPVNKSKGKKQEKHRRSKDKGKKIEKTQHVSLAMLKKEASRSNEHRRRYMRYLRKNWEPSAKIDKCMELVEQFQNDGKKTIVFSQFVSLLDLIQVPMDERKINCLRYDGSMSADHRNEAIQTFTDSVDYNVMLISLKAGNAGLNLVAASRVIILDPFWNPFIEMQAVDRAYRIGQQNSVQVHRILIEGTVEDRIIELQERKRKLVDSALDEGANKDLGRLDVRQLAYLFGVGHA